MINKQQLIANLMALNISKNPFSVEIKDENSVVATWKLVDAEWIKLFAKAGLKEAYEITLTLDEVNQSVSYNERKGSITWQAGVPKTSYQVEKFSGKTRSVNKKMAFGIRTDGAIGELYKVDFSTKRIKDPLFEIVENAGWKIKRSFIAKLFGL